MSGFNLPEHESNIAGNYFVNSSSVNDDKYCEMELTCQDPKFRNIKKPTIDKMLPADSYQYNILNNDVTKTGKSESRMRYRGSVDHGTGINGFPYGQMQYKRSRQYPKASNGFSLEMPSYRVTAANLNAQYMDKYPINSYVLINPNPVQEMSNIHSHANSYNSNGTYVNNTKTANCCGSSFHINSQNPLVQSSSSPFHSTYPTDSNDQCNQSQYLQSQNVAFSNNLNDLDMKTIEEGFVNQTMINYISDINLNNAVYRNNNPALNNSRLGQMMYIPEGLIPCRDNGQMQSPDILESTIPRYREREEATGYNDLINNNKCHLPALATDAKHLNNNVAPNPAINYQSFCLQQFLPCSNDKTNTENIVPNDPRLKFVQNLDGSESYWVQQSDFPVYYSQIRPEKQSDQQSYDIIRPNINVVHNEVSAAVPSSIDPLSPSINVPLVECDPMVEMFNSVEEKSPDIKRVGKFTIKTSRNHDKNVSTIPTTENTKNSSISLRGELRKEDANKTGGVSGNQQPRSRFKKARFKETSERYNIFGFFTSDCRFKVIPTKIMELSDKKVHHLSQDYKVNLCESCGDHDSGYRCHSNEYYNKDFLFWDNGDRISVCDKSDHDKENYCQFHAKFLKLLNQNQNLNHSKIVPPQYFNDPSTTLSSSPTVIRAVFVSTPENETYAMNIDNHISQNVALSAPPASPSMMNSRPVSYFDYNVHSPQSGAAMVMLRCQTPVLLSNVSRNASLVSEAISIEKMNHRCPSRISIDSDSINIIGQEHIMTDRQSVCLDGTGFIDEYRPGDTIYNNCQQSIYNGYIPGVIYSIPSQVIPSSSMNIVAARRNLDHTMILPNPEERPLSSPTSSINKWQDLDEHLNSLKSMIHNLVHSEQQLMMNEMQSLIEANECLRAELSLVQRRSHYLEGVLKEHNVPLDMYNTHENTSMPTLSKDSHHDHDHNIDTSFIGDKQP